MMAPGDGMIIHGGGGKRGSAHASHYARSSHCMLEDSSCPAQPALS